MKYENVQPKEGINVSDKNPLTEFFILLFGTLVIGILVSTFLAFGIGWLAKKIPFEHEKVLAEPFESYIEKHNKPQLNAYLKDLTNRIEACSKLPYDIDTKVHYSNSAQFNAFATLGGHIFLFDGLLQRIENENQLAMILGHEIGHVKHRDPIVGLGRGAVISVTFSLLVGNSTNVLGDAGLLTMLTFGRSMESDSDENGVEALNRCYGHANGSYQTFELFKKIRTEMGVKDSMVPFFQTHPLDDDRISDIKTYAADKGISIQGDLTPLPEDFKSWLNQPSSVFIKQD